MVQSQLKKKKDKKKRKRKDDGNSNDKRKRLKKGSGEFKCPFHHAPSKFFKRKDHLFRHFKKAHDLTKDDCKETDRLMRCITCSNELRRKCDKIKQKRTSKLFPKSISAFIYSFI